jgi:hypothetical protein
MAAGSNPFGGSNTGAITNPGTPKSKQSFHSHSDSQINGTAGAAGKLTKAITSMHKLPTIGGASGAGGGESSSASQGTADLDF